MTDHWSAKYIGIPYRDLGRDLTGVDCWGLAFVAYPAELGINVPSYTGYASTHELAEVETVIAGATGSTIWQPVHRLAQAFDLAVFRLGQYRRHIGIVVSRGMMLHAHDDCVKIEHYATARWESRLTGIYRHVEMVSRGVQ